MTNSVTIFVPTFNEARNIGAAIKSITTAIKSVTDDYEIIIVNDGSTDQTQSICQKLAAKNKHIKLLHHSQNLGIGASFQEVVAKASKKYITVFPGDNDMASASLRRVCEKMTAADLVLAYPTNQRHRSLVRRFLSTSFTRLMNLLFDLQLKYYNGPFIHKRALIQEMHFHSAGFLIYAELKLRLIRQGRSFIEIPFEHTGRRHGTSKAVSLHNMFDTARTILALLHDKTIMQKRNSI